MYQKKQIFVWIIYSLIFLLFSVNASAEYGGQCVRYVKNQKPGGYAWDGYLPNKKNGKPVVSICDKQAIKDKKCEQWIGANDIWNKFYVQSRGGEAKKNSVLVLDSFKGNLVGHVAIVTKVDGKKIYVKHSNWDSSDTVSTGYYTLVGDGTVKYTTSNNVTWKTPYPLLGFVYQP